MAIRETLGQGYEKVRDKATDGYKILREKTERIPKKAYGMAAAAGGGLMVGLASAKDRAKETAANVSGDTGSLFVIILFIMYIVDLADFGGGRYTGFVFQLPAFSSTYAWNVLTSVIFGFFVLIYFLDKIVRNEWDWVSRETFSFFLFAFIMSFLLIFNQWFASPKAIFHFIFIVVFGFTFVRSCDGPFSSYLYISTFLFLDFFGYAYFQQIVAFKYVPFAYLWIALYIYRKTQNLLSLIAIVSILFILFLFVYKDANEISGGYFWVKSTDGLTLEETMGDLRQGIGSFIDAWLGTLERQMQYAITGKVEENKYEPLGVYLVELQPSQPVYFQDENVIILGTVEARTLNDPIKIEMGCRIKGKKKEGDKEADEVDTEKFSVYTSEQQPFACKFDRCCKPNECTKEVLSNCVLKEGTNTIIAYADFNFETLSYLKTYFMSRERIRAMVRENIDPFNEFGITDKNPIAVYTNGPVEIGMSVTTSLTGASLVGVSIAEGAEDVYAGYPTLSISLRNREGWEGKIKNISSFLLFFPKGIELENPEEDCYGWVFKNVEDSKYSKACKEKFCGKLQEGECSEVCDTIQGYYLDVENKEVQKKLDDFEKFSFFRCRLKPNKDALEGTPITTKIFAVAAEYNYTLEKSVVASVQKIPEEDIVEAGEGMEGECPSYACLEYEGDWWSVTGNVDSSYEGDKWKVNECYYSKNEYCESKNCGKSGKCIEEESGEVCGDGVCGSGETCGLIDIEKCSHTSCTSPKCYYGCQETPLPAGSTNDECKDGRACDGEGNCISQERICMGECKEGCYCGPSVCEVARLNTNCEESGKTCCIPKDRE
ncbi:oligosaccharide repeat unit polymerase [Candidatus Woesearchaeota archaeon]|nr:oligosaccharide repeat unit polymerase [Candidatus Woesearchaeota archaeon]